MGLKNNNYIIIKKYNKKSHRNFGKDLNKINITAGVY